MACCLTSHYTLPHCRWCIYSHILTTWFYFICDISQKLAVGSCIMTWPGATWAWISFNINPYFTIEVSRNIFDHLINLSCWAFASAWEHINIGWKTSTFGMCQALGSVMIDSSKRAVTSNNSKSESVFFQALKYRLSIKLRDINTQSAVCGIKKDNSCKK